MSNLPKSWQTLADSYDTLSDEKKLKLLNYLYHKKQMSYRMIADEVGTYHAKIRRDANRVGLVARDKAEAQKVAMEAGRNEHPTQGKQRTEDEKVRISETMADFWDEMDEDEYQRRVEISKQNWEQRDDKEEFLRKGSDAIRAAAKKGSKLEKFFYENLTSRGFTVYYHREHLIKNELMEVDLLLPKLGLAIEVDGPSHFEPIWGEEQLKKARRADNEKDGLLMGAGFRIIRIRQKRRNLSQKYKRDLLEALMKELDSKEMRTVVEI